MGSGPRIPVQTPTRFASSTTKSLDWGNVADTKVLLEARRQGNGDRREDGRRV